MLVEIGVDVKAKTLHGATALITAAAGGHKEILCFLLENGSHVDERNNHGNTALSWAAWEGHESIVRRVLQEKGADVNGFNTGGYTALSLAAKAGNEGIVRKGGQRNTKVQGRRWDYGPNQSTYGSFVWAQGGCAVVAGEWSGSRRGDCHKVHSAEVDDVITDVRGEYNGKGGRCTSAGGEWGQYAGQTHDFQR
jgi:Ankyrin repeats (3 copies)